MFKILHPKVSNGERIGATTKYRCQFCRFPVDGNKRKNSPLENLTDGNTIVVSGGRATSVTATSGCPNCGSLNFSPHVPQGQIIRPEDRPGLLADWSQRLKRFYERF